MLSYRQYLQEIKYTDIYGGQFEEFRKKYSKQSTGWLYVQFTNYSKDVLEKNPYDNPDHSDPVGIYGYPMKYVLNNPADIWYGANAKYLRVLKDKSKNNLRLTYIDEADCYNLLRKAFGWDYKEVDKKIKQLRKYNNRDLTGKTKWGKIFFSLVQLDFDNMIKDNNDSYRQTEGKPTTRTGLQQTEIIKKLGYDAIEDEATTLKQAVINDREPEQIIFLTRSSFEVVEVFNLRGAESGKPIEGSLVVQKETHSMSKLGAEMVKIMDDSIAEKHENYDNIVIYTKKGRKITIKKEDTSINWRMENLKLGQKKHKYSKLSSPIRFIVIIDSEFGYGNNRIDFSSSMSVNDMIKEFRLGWLRIKSYPLNDNFKPLSKKYEDELEKEKNRQRIMKEIEKENKEFKDNLDRYKSDFLEISEMFNVKFDKDDLDKLDRTIFREVFVLQLIKGKEKIEWKDYVNEEDYKVGEKLFTLAIKMYEYADEHFQNHEKDRFIRYAKAHNILSFNIFNDIIKRMSGEKE